MSEIKSFSDYTSKYNSNVDFSALFSGTSDSSSVGNTNMLSDYAAIKNGSYGKLMKAYYAKQDAEKLSGKGDTSQKLTLMKTSADSLKKSADALNDSSLLEKKKIKKKDEKTGEEIEVEDYDWDKITKAVKSFVEDYNDVVKEAGESNTKDVLRNASWMTGMTDKNSNMLAKIGITIGKGNKLEYMENVTTDFSYAKDIRLFGMQKYLAKKQIDVYDEELRHWIKSRQYWIYNTIFAHSISLLRQLIIIGWLVYSVVFNGLSIGNFTLYTASAAAFSNAINEILQALSALRERSAHTDDYRSFMDIPSADDKAKTIPIPPADKYTFEFKNVSFKYRGQEKYALKNVNLTLHAGEKLAVVGLNGAGKSTFIKLLLRLYDVTEGCILMNGTDIRKFDRKEYYELFAPAFQDVMVFAFPVAENVSMKEPFNTDKAEAEKMLRLAGLGDKLDKLEKGVDTELLKVLYDDGVDLSGGEKQKLALARALYKKSKIIVLDEPTAALDALAEFRLYQSFNELVGDRTAVYISHRLSSTRFCDRVAMFKDGEMVEIGTHDSLMEADGAYADMFRVQAQYYVEDKDIFDVPCQEVTSNG